MFKRSHAAFLVLLFVAAAYSQQPATSGTFILHKFAKAIGKETYSIAATGDTYTLTSHFLFTDRGSKVPLETSFTASSSTLAPISYSAKGRSARESAMDDQLSVQENTINITLSGKSQTVTPQGKWFITDGYSPVAMQEQMMRWWLANNKPTEFTVYPAASKVHIEPSATITINGTAAHGYTVAGLIWGQESLWLDDSRNLVALVSTDAEFDHFEAAREPYESSLDQFISAAVQANLGALAKLTASARVAPAQRLAITGATLENTNGNAPIPDSVILIEDGVITAAGSRSKIRIPSDTTILDASGKYAIPGLWDMHAHYEQVEWGPIYLASGVTSVRDVGNEFNFITTLHTELDRKDNPAIGPHLDFAGIIDGPGPVSLGAVIAATPAEGIALVDKYKAAGARQIKIYSSMQPNVLKAITARAHSLGLTVTGHIPDGMTAIEGVNDGMDQINHIQYEMPYFTHQPVGLDGKPDRTKPPILDLDSPRARDLITTFKTHYTVLDPTMALFETFMHTEPLNQLEPGIDHVAPQLREALDSPPAANPDLAKARWAAFIATLRTLHQAGIPIIAGTDQAIPGYSLHRELEIYVQAGFTSLQALQSATIVAAKALGVQNESGSIEPGKRADVLILDADPLADIHNTRKVWRTVAAGSVYSPAPLWTSVDFKP
ncbi:amidohydrolase family protein [Terracidiphilus gabretensis]|uniref:amidohydrolase family protein n=1 Tax=Terracidiphilus gabretensis TaxID=1577687 RepID=UPI00071B6949|nr:amidohydrolase family protein [Terracidiphilus gabretensis]